METPRTEQEVIVLEELRSIAQKYLQSFYFSDHFKIDVEINRQSNPDLVGEDALEIEALEEDFSEEENARALLATSVQNTVDFVMREFQENDDGMNDEDGDDEQEDEEETITLPHYLDGTKVAMVNEFVNYADHPLAEACYLLVEDNVNGFLDDWEISDIAFLLDIAAFDEIFNIRGGQAWDRVQRKYYGGGNEPGANDEADAALVALHPLIKKAQLEVRSAFQKLQPTLPLEN